MEKHREGVVVSGMLLNEPKPSSVTDTPISFDNVFLMVELQSLSWCSLNGSLGTQPTRWDPGAKDQSKIISTLQIIACPTEMEAALVSTLVPSC